MRASEESVSSLVVSWVICGCRVWMRVVREAMVVSEGVRVRESVGVALVGERNLMVSVLAE